ncbi:MAG: tRNA (adenosine(37)-N6)-threonylcarbamoyltransferase complex dimerization subunit type 1 TsaB [Synergistales bacterium]|nr:tRNA (adenosine(37)-N6)-threonylcarbamoyltransferase complex dimerization subunit type 1 TsaB [Synergistales bacterium]
MGVTLGIDCSLRATNIGLVEDGSCIGETTLVSGRRQASALPGLVDHLFASLGCSLQDLDLIAIANGPGYFTGIRVGLAYGAALAHGLGIPVCPVSTLEAMAWQLPVPGRRVYPVVRARRNLVFTGGFLCTDEGGLCSILGETVMPEDECLKILASEERTTVLCNDRASLSFLEGAAMPVIDGITARGGTVARIGGRRIDQAVAPDTIQGNYLRSPDIG